jgi:Raf kinase inhibitor-like YbhB/YbcL family protein
MHKSLLFLTICGFMALSCISTHSMQVSSPQLLVEQEIPEYMTFDSKNINPAIVWSGVPPKAESLVLICHNPDENDMSHWVVYNIPPELDALPEDLGNRRILRSGAIQANNGFKTVGWAGPDPQYGTQRYVFTLYAVDTKISPEPRLQNRVGVLSMIRNHVIAEASFERVYTKK